MSETLYERLGGNEAIAAVVDEFYERVLADDDLEHFFEETDMQAQRAHQTQFLSSVTGGPVEYTGADMQTAHAHLEIDTAAFDAIATHLDEALASFDVEESARNEVLDAVERYRDDIVTA